MSEPSNQISRDNRKLTRLMIVTIFVAFALSPFASSQPDGLERVAEDSGFVERANDGFVWSPFPDYEVGIHSSDFVKVGTAGLVGVGVMTAFLYGFGFILARGRNSHAKQNPDRSSSPSG